MLSADMQKVCLILRPNLRFFRNFRQILNTKSTTFNNELTQHIGLFSSFGAISGYIIHNPSKIFATLGRVGAAVFDV